MSASGMIFFMPVVVKDFSKTISNTTVGLLLMLPPAFGAIACWVMGWHSDKTMERKYHTAAAIAIGLIGFGMSAIFPSSVVKMIGIILGAICVYSFMPAFWAIPSIYLAGTSAAVGMALINSCNAFGSFAAGFISGYMKSIGNNAVFIYYSVCLFLALILCLSLRLEKVEKIATGPTDR
jgi:ACS family tartrate transporter-like MFS transporter